MFLIRILLKSIFTNIDKSILWIERNVKDTQEPSNLFDFHWNCIQKSVWVELPKNWRKKEEKIRLRKNRNIVWLDSFWGWWRFLLECRKVPCIYENQRESALQYTGMILSTIVPHSTLHWEPFVSIKKRSFHSSSSVFSCSFSFVWCLWCRWWRWWCLDFVWFEWCSWSSLSLELDLIQQLFLWKYLSETCCWSSFMLDTDSFFV